jgi:hypothetical protein
VRAIRVIREDGFAFGASRRPQRHPISGPELAHVTLRQARINHPVAGDDLVRGVSAESAN